MPALTAEQVKELSKQFFRIVTSLGQFREDNWETLTKSQHQKLSHLQRSIYSYSDDLLALSSVLKLKEVDSELTEMNQVTDEVHQALQNTQRVEKVIGIAAKVVMLGGAVVSQSPLAIISSLSELTQEVNPET
ncbi:hypothetical protein [Tunicatimonas pelagia]|uniref:hypothetical protein n=1 Tax=Tunicatimonas pelagia TaxID=931531 RepID=UPI002665F226|nr:hypothetical protein [Tunicatimonas pelagia]WKN44624.1 hypothetical protein P0M28_06560 [Tunicatimonas pelagia]